MNHPRVLLDRVLGVQVRAVHPPALCTARTTTPDRPIVLPPRWDDRASPYPARCLRVGGDDGPVVNALWREGKNRTSKGRQPEDTSVCRPEARSRVQLARGGRGDRSAQPTWFLGILTPSCFDHPQPTVRKPGKGMSWLKS